MQKGAKRSPDELREVVADVDRDIASGLKKTAALAKHRLQYKTYERFRAGAIDAGSQLITYRSEPRPYRRKQINQMTPVITLLSTAIQLLNQIGGQNNGE